MTSPGAGWPAGLNPEDYRGVPGLYVLHFDQPVGYGTEQGNAGANGRGYGDQQHYIGQSVDIGKRIHDHNRESRRSAEYVKHARAQGISYHLSYVRRIDDPERRLAVEHAAQQAPRRWCPTCNRPAPLGA
jgi:predicted GIY-YIG superfamily endonuclease